MKRILSTLAASALMALALGAAPATAADLDYDSARPAHDSLVEAVGHRHHWRHRNHFRHFGHFRPRHCHWDRVCWRDRWGHKHCDVERVCGRRWH